MNLSKRIVILLMVCSLAGVANAAPPEKAMETSAPITSSEVNSLLHRLNEIDEMDKSDLDGTEKKALRKEVKSIKKTLNNSGIYLSGGAIIIVILLLILLL